MVTGGLDTNWVAPKVLIIPTYTGKLSGAAGEIFISGSYLYIMPTKDHLYQLSGSHFI